ncbi:MAG: CBS domain-containing protein [Polyangiaceae bacterium]|nr:CBS domain-containing protein [Polyangiaceae bacterium]
MFCHEIAGRGIAPAGLKQTAQQIAIRFAAERVGWLPVCDESFAVVGIITERDLALQVCAENLLAAEVPVENVMRREVITCSADASLREAEELMMRSRVSRLVILDPEGRLFGVISLTDILHYSDPLRAAGVARTIKDSEFRVRSHKPPARQA